MTPQTTKIKLMQGILGLNFASLIKGARIDKNALIRSAVNSFFAVTPFQAKDQIKLEENFVQIPLITLDQILGTNKVRTLLNVQSYEDGMLPSYEAMVLLSILISKNPKEVLEIGTFMGHTTKAMAENLPTAIIHTIDLPLDYKKENDHIVLPKDDFHLIHRRKVGREFRNTGLATQIKQHYCDTAITDFSTIGNPTFFFIDGSHTYAYCKQDSEKCYNLCQGAGTFLWHDCNLSHPGVIHFILEWRKLGRDIKRIEGTTIAYWSNSPK